MRVEGIEPNIELNFDCNISLGSMRRTEVPGMSYVRHEVVSANVSRTTSGSIYVSTGMNLLCINLKGTLIGRSNTQSRPIIVPPRSVAFVRSSRLLVQVARGEHHCVLLSWHRDIASLLDAWLQGKIGRSPGLATRNVACKPIDPVFANAVDRFDSAAGNPGEYLEPMVLSVLYEVVSRLMVGPDQVQLANIPAGLPETVQELVNEVRLNSSVQWPLKDAAGKAGYSPFHFSRVFKGLVGYGFHEYVDRCRTESAVEQLITTDHAVDLVASTCGFGTTQGLRESVKEYLGLVPSELRATNETTSDST